MGDTGPCGPCSEIHIDRGEEACDGRPHAGEACGVNVNGCERFIELANLVFIQFNRDAAGVLTPLPMKHVDTGTGLERVAAVLQSIETGKLLGNYDIDVFRRIINRIEKSTPASRFIRYGFNNPSDDISFRAIADHARAISFLIAEGVRPGNTDREYVLRRLIRRAVRHGRKLGLGEQFLWQICKEVADAMGDSYPELKENSPKIVEVASSEAMKFGETLGRGLELVREWLERKRRIKSNLFPGDIAFQLHDTYGFPIDLTQDLLRDEGFTVNMAGFNRLMEQQRERGGRRAKRKPARRKSSSARASLRASSETIATKPNRKCGKSSPIPRKASR